MQDTTTHRTTRQEAAIYPRLRGFTVNRPARRREREGNVLVLAAFMMVALLGMVAFSVDMGTIVVARTEAQRAADSAALAAAWELVADDRLQGYGSDMQANMRTIAAEYANSNRVAYRSPDIQANAANATDGDIVIGRLNTPSDYSEALELNSSEGDNAITVRVRMTNARSSALPLSFARIFGINAVDVTAEATAIFDDNIVGYRVTDNTGNSGLMPFAIHVDAWNDLLDGITATDNWSYNPETGQVSPGGDGIPELNMYPGGGSSSSSSSNGNGNGNGNGGGNSNGNGGGGVGQSQVAPGNFGTVDIGNSSNSAADLRRQIEFGLNETDLSHHGGELKLDPATQRLELNGDTGLTASMKSALEKIVGDGRSIMLYDQVGGNGSNATFSIMGFAGIRVMEFSLTGGSKNIMIQPAVVADPTAISGDYGQNYFVGQPVRLVR